MRLFAKVVNYPKRQGLLNELDICVNKRDEAVQSRFVWHILNGTVRNKAEECYKAGATVAQVKSITEKEGR